MKSYWIRAGPKSSDWCPYEKKEVWIQRQRHAERTPCKDRGRDWRVTAPSQGTPRIVGNHQKPEEARKGSPLETSD